MKQKRYTIKNHTSGKTYNVSATSFADAKKKYNQFIKDAIAFDSYIDIDMIDISEDGVHEFARKYKLKVARIKANRGMIEVKLEGRKEDLLKAITSKTLGYDKSDADWLIEDSLTKDAISTQKVEDILKKVGLIRRKHYGISSGNYITFDDIADYDKRNALAALRRAFGEKNVTYTRDDDTVEIKGFVKDSITEDARITKAQILSQLAKHFKDRFDVFIFGNNVEISSDTVASSMLFDEIYRKNIFGKLSNDYMSAPYDEDFVLLKLDKMKIGSVKDSVEDSITKDNRHTFEALWYTDPDFDKVMSQTFATEKEAMDFYRKNKGKPSFHGWWITERRPGSWDVKRDILMDSITKDSSAIIEWDDDNVNQAKSFASRFGLTVKYKHNRNAGYRQSEHEMKFIGKEENLLKLLKHFDLSKEEVVWTDSTTNDANIAQNTIKETFLPNEIEPDHIKYVGFSDERKISFYEYEGTYYAFYDLDNRVVRVDKDEVQRILRKNILGEEVENIDVGPLKKYEGDDE